IKTSKLHPWLGGNGFDLVRVVGPNGLSERQIIYVAESRRSGRQLGRNKKLRIECVISSRRRVHRAAALIRTNRLPVVVKGNDGSPVVRRPAPAFQIAKEIMGAAIGAEVLDGLLTGLIEVDSLSGSNCHSIERRRSRPAPHGVREDKG